MSLAGASLVTLAAVTLGWHGGGGVLPGARRTHARRAPLAIAMDERPPLTEEERLALRLPTQRCAKEPFHDEIRPELKSWAYAEPSACDAQWQQRLDARGV